MLAMGNRSSNTQNSHSLPSALYRLTYYSHYVRTHFLRTHISTSDVFIDVDALLEELRNLPPPAESNECLTQTEPTRTFITDEINDICGGFFAEFLMPNIKTYLATCDRLVPVLDLAMLTAGDRKLVLDTLELAHAIFDNFVSISLTIQQLSDPLSELPTHSFVRKYLLGFIDRALASPQCLNDIHSELEILKSKIQEREDEARTSFFLSDTKWIYDIWESCPEFKALDSWLTEDIPATALEIVAQGCMATGPTPNDVSQSPIMTAKLTRNSSLVIENLRASTTRPLGVSQSLSALPTSASRPIKRLPTRGASLSRTQSLSAMLPPQAQARVMTALGTVAEVEEE
ncbi:uncharacterized protein EDB91DRAFT_844437 [Suillus paluster]|uniref:uncharacterized protein n=1 Tax=Suillus paluster TaxID=48578 RepID=UPI001B865612|nr:uncharacterized protein EDB91DRAFT_844437 [Suillus paluster]KAG1728869.1 hypothetical protein EDB91DRAFT_844437 [Suillus paluster]